MQKKKIESLWKKSGWVCKILDIHKDATSQEKVNKGDVWVEPQEVHAGHPSLCQLSAPPAKHRKALHQKSPLTKW